MDAGAGKVWLHPPGTVCKTWGFVQTFCTPDQSHRGLSSSLQIHVKGMTCAACSTSVERILRWGHKQRAAGRRVCNNPGFQLQQPRQLSQWGHRLSHSSPWLTGYPSGSCRSHDGVRKASVALLQEQAEVCHLPRPVQLPAPLQQHIASPLPHPLALPHAATAMQSTAMQSYASPEPPSPPEPTMQAFPLAHTPLQSLPRRWNTMRFVRQLQPWQRLWMTQGLRQSCYQRHPS